MKPSMNQSIVVNIPKVDEDGKVEFDKFGKPITDPIYSVARVRFKSNLVKNSKGQEVISDLEIDTPHNFNVKSGNVLEYTTITKETGNCTVIAIEEITNLAGNRVLYKTVWANE